MARYQFNKELVANILLIFFVKLCGILSIYYLKLRKITKPVNGVYNDFTPFHFILYGYVIEIY